MHWRGLVGLEFLNLAALVVSASVPASTKGSDCVLSLSVMALQMRYKVVVEGTIFPAFLRCSVNLHVHAGFQRGEKTVKCSQQHVL